MCPGDKGKCLFTPIHNCLQRLYFLLALRAAHYANATILCAIGAYTLEAVLACSDSFGLRMPETPHLTPPASDTFGAILRTLSWAVNELPMLGRGTGV